jgi:(1->4)-alpha-D-glucan 1-alpha-D-glucosylmutase
MAFQKGSYEPLDASGQFQDHVIAFARKDGNTTIVTVVPRFLTALVQPGEHPVGTQVWADTTVKLPQHSFSHWENAITGQRIQHSAELAVGEILNQFPVALLVSKAQ